MRLQETHTHTRTFNLTAESEGAALTRGACFTDQPVSEDGEEAKQEGGADAGQ